MKHRHAPLLKEKEKVDMEERRAAEQSNVQTPLGSSEESGSSQKKVGSVRINSCSPAMLVSIEIKHVLQEIKICPDNLRHPKVEGVMIRNNINPPAALANIEAIYLNGSQR